jgi:hypothetical protein
VTTRTIKPGSREQFEQSWRPAEFPPGLVGAYVLYAEDGDDVVGISIWAPRRRAIATATRTSRPGAKRSWIPSCLEERSTFYTGRELAIPGR